MSHFTVAVVTKDKNRIKEILKPYWEELEVEPYIDETKEQIIENAKKKKERYSNEVLNGVTDKYKERYIDATTDEELYKIEVEEFYEVDCFDKNGNHLSTYNPNSKWDWYDIGGRWRNQLLTKKDNDDTFENNSFVEHFGYFKDIKPAPKGYKWVNGAKIKDIDFNKMNEGKEEPFYTWALVDENGWYEQGKMGWWAMSDATDESIDQFNEKFQEYIKAEENQEKYLVIVDCHI